MASLGMRHVALNVKDPQLSKEFYTRVLGMVVEWEPDPDNVYLTTLGPRGALDNIALHRHAGTSETRAGALDHIGFFFSEISDIDIWYSKIKNAGAKILKEIKTHRDGARSFYFSDPDGIVIQFLYHPPISNPGVPVKT